MNWTTVEKVEKVEKDIGSHNPPNLYCIWRKRIEFGNQTYKRNVNFFRATLKMFFCMRNAELKDEFYDLCLDDLYVQMLRAVWFILIIERPQNKERCM